MRNSTLGMVLAVSATLVAALSALPAAAASVVVSSTGDDSDGDTSSIANLIANPGPDGTISLREALLAANNTPGPNAISFAPALAGQTIALTKRFAPITRDGITITGLTSNGQPNITIDASGASNPGAILFIAASNFTMNGLRFSFIPSSFNGLQIGGSGFGLMGQLVNAPAQISGFRIAGNAFSNGTGSNTFAIFVSHTINVTNGATISDVVIANNTFTNLFEAVNLQAGGSNNLIQNVVIFGNSFSQMTANATSAVELGNIGGSNNQIRRTQIVQNVFTGNLQGIALDNGGTASVIDDTLITRNVFSGNQAAISPIVGGNGAGASNNTITNTRIVNNLVNRSGFNGQAGGVAVRITDNDPGASANTVNGVSIINNTFFGPGPDGSSIWVTSNGGGVSNVAALNTIFWGNGGLDFVGLTPAQVQYSITAQPGFNLNNNVNADPLFVSSGIGNFHLQSASPARHAGTSSGAPAFDLDCQPRGSPPSIGAYEFNGPNICRTNPVGQLNSTHDFNGDGISDILLRNTGGGIAAWLMNSSGAIQSALGVGAATNDWVIVGQRDLNGDGVHDILFRNNDGSIAEWLMTGNGTIMSALGLGNPTTAWTIVGTGDFNADGIGDILLRGAGTSVAILYMNSSGMIASGVGVGSLPNDWTVAGTGDFDGDGIWDILWYNTTSGGIALWLMNSSGTVKSPVGLGALPVGVWSIAGTGDFNGDGISDILFLGDGTAVAIWFMNNGGAVGSAQGVGSMAPGWTIAQTGDFNGDGRSDILWYNATSGGIAAWLMNGTTVASAVSIGSLPPASWSIATANAD